MSHRRPRSAAAVACALALMAASAAATAQTDPRELRRADERLRALREEARSLLAQERTLLVELRRFEVERSLKAEELRRLEADIARIEEELAETGRHLSLLARARDEQAPALRGRLREVYKLGAGGYVRLLLGLEHPRELGRALRIVSGLAARDRERVRAHQSTIASLADAQRALETRRGELETRRRDAAGTRAALDRAVRERAALVASIDRQRDLNAQLTGELQAAEAQLQRTMAGLESASPAGLPLRTLQGTLDWPAGGDVVTSFDRGASARAGANVRRRGIAIAAKAGAPVRAVHTGTVAHAAPFSGFGNLVILDHGTQAFSVYGYLDEVHVARGARVAAGETVGSVGRDPAGQATLYFELRVDGQPVDPLQWLKGRPKE